MFLLDTYISTVGLQWTKHLVTAENLQAIVTDHDAGMLTNAVCYNPPISLDTYPDLGNTIHESPVSKP